MDKIRRKFIKASFIGALFGPFILKVDELYAKTIKKISDNIAKRLKYVENVEKLKPISSKYKKGYRCLNCKFYKRGKKKVADKWTGEEKEGSDYFAKCSMASNRYVNRMGHCHVYSWDKRNFPKLS